MYRRVKFSASESRSDVYFATGASKYLIIFHARNLTEPLCYEPHKMPRNFPSGVKLAMENLLAIYHLLSIWKECRLQSVLF